MLARRLADAPVPERARLDVVGSVLSATGLALMVFAVLRSGEWGWVQPKAGAPSWFHISPVVWLFVAGLGVVWAFFQWEARVKARGGEPLLDTSILANSQLVGGLTMFFFQYLVQMGVFFVVPLYLSVVLGLSALDTGVRLLPLSATLLLAAVGIPRVFPAASPRRVVRIGVLALLAGTLVLLGGLDPGAGAEIVLVPMLLIGLGMGALASQLGNVTVSAVPDERSPEVGGIQNTVTNLGASFGTALAGSLMIAALTTSFLSNIDNNPAVPAEVSQQAQVQLAAGVPFISDADLSAALSDAGVHPDVADAALAANEDARLDGLRAALAILAVLAAISLFFVPRIPAAQPRAASP